MVKNKRLIHLGIFFLTAGFWLLPFWTARVFIGFTGTPDSPPAAAVLSAESSRSAGQVRYLEARSYTGVTETVAVYVYPGRPVTYSGIFTVRNPTGQLLHSQVKEVKTSAGGELDVTAAVYFGGPAAESGLTLNPGQTAPLDLQITAAPSLPQPLPVEVSFTVVSY